MLFSIVATPFRIPTQSVGGFHFPCVLCSTSSWDIILMMEHRNRLFRVRRILRFCLAAPGIPGKEGKGIGSDGQSRFHHGGIAAGC